MKPSSEILRILEEMRRRFGDIELKGKEREENLRELGFLPGSINIELKKDFAKQQGANLQQNFPEQLSDMGVKVNLQGREQLAHRRQMTVEAITKELEERAEKHEETGAYEDKEGSNKDHETGDSK